MSYNGKNYHGWQIQPNAVTVQAVLENALSLLLKNKIEVTGAGRTDTGVHAKYFVAHFDTDNAAIDCEKLKFQLNKFLPTDIFIKNIYPVTDTAHSRFDAISRTYEYFISTKKNPFFIDFAWFIHFNSDIRIMNEAAAILLEYTDFTSFSKLHTDTKTNNCKIFHAQWEEKNDLLVFTIKADRFLRNMVRAIVGTSIDVGSGKISIPEFRNIIESKNRCNAGQSVPPQGLSLVDIEYPDKVKSYKVESYKVK